MCQPKAVEIMSTLWTFFMIEIGKSQTTLKFRTPLHSRLCNQAAHRENQIFSDPASKLQHLKSQLASWRAYFQYLGVDTKVEVHERIALGCIRSSHLQLLWDGICREHRHSVPCWSIADHGCTCSNNLHCQDSFNNFICHATISILQLQKEFKSSSLFKLPLSYAHWNTSGFLVS